MSRSALRRVVDRLHEAQVPFALIGASALAARGYSRSTADVDLLVADTAVLASRFWDPVRRFASVDVRPGDIDDPLAGVVRAGPRARLPVDVVVIPTRWSRRILDRALGAPGRSTILDAQLPVASAADILLLKLYASANAHIEDADLILSGADRLRILAEADAEVLYLPVESQERWAHFRRVPRL